MRKLIFAISLLLMPFTASADSISTFKKLCLPYLGKPQSIVKAAKKSGFKIDKLGEGQFMGFRKTTDESIQVNAFTQHAFECAVTTSDMQNPKSVSKKFFEEIGLPTRKNPVRGKIAGKTYTFLHDTNGGEAFVVFAD